MVPKKLEIVDPGALRVPRPSALRATRPPGDRVGRTPPVVGGSLRGGAPPKWSHKDSEILSVENVELLSCRDFLKIDQQEFMKEGKP